MVDGITTEGTHETDDMVRQKAKAGFRSTLTHFQITEGGSLRGSNHPSVL